MSVSSACLRGVDSTTYPHLQLAALRLKANETATSAPVRTATAYQSVGCHPIAPPDTVVSAVIHRQTILIRGGKGASFVGMTQSGCQLFKLTQHFHEEMY
jgi:hypothetical protein